jgi:ferrous iron transport protein A
MTLREAKEEKEYVILEVKTEDEELNSFLFSLGCYSGEVITVISRLKCGMIVLIKNSKYNFDNRLAEAIKVS